MRRLSIEELKKTYIGKTIYEDKLQKAGDVWNLTITDGKLCGHFYWNDERHTYYDDFEIAVDETMKILDISPLDTNTADGGGIEPCRYTLVHNGVFDQLLKAATAMT